ncbi:MAG TPA: hypothetical protein DCZ03_10010 [Gammaproteobacteria bacterium]|nr:hypothetical protein [Gammaproteobacteria bacterium]
MGQFVIYSNELNSLAEGSSIDGTYEFFSLGISVQVANWIVVAESSHRAASNLSSVQSIDGYYIMLGHRFHTVLLHMTYSVWADDQHESNFIRGRDHKEVIVGINYDIDSHQTLKIQLHYGDPKNGSMANYRRLSPDIDDVYAFMISYNWVF